jgi:hypothetical protein
VYAPTQQVKARKGVDLVFQETRRTIRGSELIRVVLVAVLVASTLVMATASPAEAYLRHGCEYDNDSIDPISYRFFSVNSTYENAFTDGQSHWNAAAVPGYFQEKSTSLDPEVNVTDGVYGGGYYALASWGCSGGFYTGNETNIRFDTDTMSSLTTAQKNAIAAHELGHAYGLADVSGSTCRVMYDVKALSGCAWFPASDDINGVNAVY